MTRAQAPLDRVGNMFGMRLPEVRLASVILAVAIAPALAGCEDPEFGRGITVRNETVVALTFQGLVDGEVVPLPGSVRPSDTGIVIDAAALGEHSRVGEDGCTTVPIAALNPDGGEVARADPPLCVGDQWVIERPSRPSAVGET